jgi:hypothetical protein
VLFFTKIIFSIKIININNYLIGLSIPAFLASTFKMALPATCPQAPWSPE